MQITANFSYGSCMQNYSCQQWTYHIRVIRITNTKQTISLSTNQNSKHLKHCHIN